MNPRAFSSLRLSALQRRLLVGLCIALTSQLYVSVWAEGFRVSAAVVLYPVLLILVMRDSHRPQTGLVTGLFVLLFRALTDLLAGVPLLQALEMEYPGGVFYLCYDALLCLLLSDRRSASYPRLWLSMLVCDGVSNLVNLMLSSRSLALSRDMLVALLWLAFGRSLAALTILFVSRSYRLLILREEHEQRYQHLFLMTADLKTELYFLKKDAEDIEAVMSSAYRLYERLEAQHADEDLTSLALSIARDVHEVKKDNLSIIRGIEGEVAGTGTDNDEQMWISDLFHILQDTMGHILGEEREKIAIQCHYETDFATEEHYRLMSILKNLVMNAAEAIQSGRGTGAIWVEEHLVGEDLVFTVQDNGPGISPRAMQNLFRVGYSTKFNPETGNISRGIGLPAVEFMVQELGGTIQVNSGPGTVPGGTDATGACFRVTIPRTAMEKGAV